MRNLNTYDWITRLLLFVAVLYAVTQLVSVVGGAKQHDFRTYYYATWAYQQGLNPYDLESLQDISGAGDHKLPFVYPPYILDLFRPFANLGYWPAYYLFLLLKIVALYGLVTVWTKVVPADKNDWWALWVTVFLGYRSAVLLDIRSGNVSIFEQLLIWSGVLLVLRSQCAVGGISIALSSMFKLLTSALIPLLVIIRRSWRSFRIALFVLFGTVCMYAVLYSAQPRLWSQFISEAGALDERGNICPSSLALLRDLADATAMGPVPVYVLYGLLCSLVFGVLTWAFIATRNSRDVYPMMYLTILGYCILAPRMKDYSLIIALLPTLHVLSSMCQRRWQVIVGCTLLWIPIIDYQSLLLSALAFTITFKWIWDHRHIPNQQVDLTLNPFRIFSDAHS